MSVIHYLLYAIASIVIAIIIGSLMMTLSEAYLGFPERSVEVVRLIVALIICFIGVEIEDMQWRKRSIDKQK